jgi:hypothetical protein
MSKTKFNDNNRRTHAAKILVQGYKKNQSNEDVHDSAASNVNKTSAFNEDMSQNQSSTSNQFLEQYRIIREDVLKLREDLSLGYDMLKVWIDKKISVRNILRLNR